MGGVGEIVIWACLPKRTETQANTGVCLCYRRSAVDEYFARTLSNRHRYTHVIRETEAPGFVAVCVSGVRVGGWCCRASVKG